MSKENISPNFEKLVAFTNSKINHFHSDQGKTHKKMMQIPRSRRNGRRILRLPAHKGTEHIEDTKQT